MNNLSEVRGLVLSTVMVFAIGCGGGGGDENGDDMGGNLEINLNNAMEEVAGAVVTLDATASNKVGGNAQSYQWTLSEKPQNSVAILSGETTQNPTFTADISGVYQASLTVVNTDNSTVTDSFRIVVLEQITNNTANDNHPYYNSDGSRIAFASDRGINGDSNVWVMDADGQNPVQITTDLAEDYRPSWSPDDTQLVFHSTRDGDHNLFIKNADGSGVSTRITSHTAADTHPKWHPTDSLLVAYRTNRSGNYDVWLKTIGVRGAVQLTNSFDVEGHPMWSPDGSKIAYSRHPANSSNNDIWVMNADGTNQTRLTNTPGVDEQHPDWSPDGTTLAFRSNRNGNYDVWTLTVDGQTLTQITNHAADDRNPTWHRDGTKILFRSNRTGNNEFFVYPLE